MENKTIASKIGSGDATIHQVHTGVETLKLINMMDLRNNCYFWKSILVHICLLILINVPKWLRCPFCYFLWTTYLCIASQGKRGVYFNFWILSITRYVLFIKPKFSISCLFHSSSLGLAANHIILRYIYLYLLDYWESGENRSQKKTRKVPFIF